MMPLDTNVISELVGTAPNPSVPAYIARLAPDSVFAAAICEAGIRYGLARVPAGRRRDDLVKRIDLFLAAGFGDQILPLDRACARHYGEIRHAREAADAPISVKDAMTAATARGHGATIATRSVKDFAACGVPLIDPWVPT
jgi:predicted nucleic acid-binding protein